MNVSRVQIILDYAAKYPHPDPKCRLDVNFSSSLICSPLAQILFGIHDSFRSFDKCRDFSNVTSILLLLGHAGVSPNACCGGIYETSTPLHIAIMLSKFMLEQLLDCFHPANMHGFEGIDITLRDNKGMNIWELVRCKKSVYSTQELIDIIKDVNMKHKHQNLAIFRQFLLGTHYRVGCNSSIFRVLFSSCIYDPNVLRYAWPFLYQPLLYPPLVN
jgi:hypothetical protein